MKLTSISSSSSSSWSSLGLLRSISGASTTSPPSLLICSAGPSLSWGWDLHVKCQGQDQKREAKALSLRGRFRINHLLNISFLSRSPSPPSSSLAAAFKAVAGSSLLLVTGTLLLFLLVVRASFLFFQIVNYSAAKAMVLTWVASQTLKAKLNACNYYKH